MSAAQPFRVGRLSCWHLDAGLQRLDGGAVFGVVPKPLWQQKICPDELNRIPLALRCLLIEHDDGLVLVDTGIGSKETPRFQEIYGVTNAGDPGPTMLEDAIRAAGHQPADVRWVINSHLHFDHAGGNTVRRGNAFVAAFDQATYVVQRREFEFGMAPNERARASYLAHNYESLAAAGRFRFVDGACDLLPGISVLPTAGHVPFHQSVMIRSGGETACFLGDLVPTTAHLRSAWIMGYDLEPLVTLDNKKALLTEAAREGWVLVFDHDPATARCRIEPGEDGRWNPEPCDVISALPVYQ